MEVKIGGGDSKMPYGDARTEVTLAAGEEKTVEIRSDARPERIVIDPDVTLLMLQRNKATVEIDED
jgi:hypothetical protein